MEKLTLYRSNRVETDKGIEYWMEVVDPDTGHGTGKWVVIHSTHPLGICRATKYEITYE